MNTLFDVIDVHKQRINTGSITFLLYTFIKFIPSKFLHCIDF